MKVRVFETDTLAAKAAASVFASEIQMSDNPVIGLNAGGSSNKVYAELIAMHKEGALDFSDVKTFEVDEMAKTHVIVDSISKNFIDHVNLKEENVHHFDSMANDLDAECVRYEELMRQEGGIGVMLAAMGNDGHVCYSEPAETLMLDTFVYTLEGKRLADTKRMFEGNEDQMPTQALSMGLGTMLRCRELVVVAFGESKADVVARITNGIIDPQCPASLYQMHNRATLFVDKAAASKL